MRLDGAGAIFFSFLFHWNLRNKIFSFGGFPVLALFMLCLPEESMALVVNTLDLLASVYNMAWISYYQSTTYFG